MPDHDTTISVTWSPEKKKVTLFNSNTQAGTVSGEGNKDYESIVYISAIANPGYVFSGWYQSSTLISQSAAYSFLMPLMDVTYQATWTAKTYTISLNNNGGTNATTSTNITYGSSFTLPIPYKDGYLFNGWGYSSGSGYTLVTNDKGVSLSNWSLTSVTTLVAQYSVDPEAANSTSIYNAAGLSAIANNPSGSYRLTANINLSGISWAPINFKGTFNGNGFTISNLTINLSDSSSNVGLFGTNSGTIKNLKITNASITAIGSGSNIGIVAGTNSGSVSNSTVNGTISTNYSKVGGVVGYLANGTMSDCTNNASVSGSTFVGGIIGYADNQYVSKSISNCTNTGNISASVDYAGGILGCSKGYGSNYRINVTNCISNSNVTGGLYVGGYIGYGKFLNFSNSTLVSN